MKYLVLAIGKLRGPEAEWCAEYQKRLKGDLDIKELTAAKSLAPEAMQRAEAALLLKHIPAKSFTFLLDELGKDMNSRAFAGLLQQRLDQGQVPLVFVIGGADGFTDDVRKRADFTVGFGSLTWPHRLVRVMLLEQIYRAQQINAGHPYHRD